MTGAELRAWREALALTRPAVARIVKVSVRALEDWESGRRRIPPWITALQEKVEREVHRD